MINIKTTPKTGKVVAIKRVTPGDELMVITKKGIVNRQSVDGIRVIGRNTQGVRLINLDANDLVMDVACVVPEDQIAEEVEHLLEAASEEAAAAEAEPVITVGSEMLSLFEEALEAEDEPVDEEDI